MQEVMYGWTRPVGKSGTFCATLRSVKIWESIRRQCVLVSDGTHCGPVSRQRSELQGIPVVHIDSGHALARGLASLRIKQG